MGKGSHPVMIVLLPVYNESSTVSGVLDQLWSLTDILLIVDDGSTDSSRQVISQWIREREEGEGEGKKIHFICMEKNEGKSLALRRGFDYILNKLKEKHVSSQDLLVITDSDGQLPCDVIPRVVSLMKEKDLDLLIGCRNFDKYPFIKKAGNRFLSGLARFLTGFPFRDTQCGFRVMKLSCLEKIYPFYHSRGYACEQQISIISALLGMKTDNHFLVDPVYYRSNSTFSDAFMITLDSILTWWKLRKKIRQDENKRQILIEKGNGVKPESVL